MMIAMLVNFGLTFLYRRTLFSVLLISAIITLQQNQSTTRIFDSSMKLVLDKCAFLILLFSCHSKWALSGDSLHFSHSSGLVSKHALLSNKLTWIYYAIWYWLYKLFAVLFWPHLTRWDIDILMSSVKMLDTYRESYNKTTFWTNKNLS